MDRQYRITILSDVHYAGAAEQTRGNDYEMRDLPRRTRALLKFYRRFIWLRYPLKHNYLLDDFIARAGSPDLVIANGDYSSDTAFIGVSDEAAFQSARECLGKLRAKFAPNFHAIMGDHELGKLSFSGVRGGLRLDSWRRSTRELDLAPFWRVELGNYVLLGVTSSLLALPLLKPDALVEEWDEWLRLRGEHLREIRGAFSTLAPGQRVILFCHDPSALPFLAREETVRAKFHQIERTVLGHLHSRLVFWNSRLLSGMPPIKFLGHTPARLSAALAEARHWRPFHPVLCPSLAGIELLKDGGYCTLDLNTTARGPSVLKLHRLPWH